MDDHHRSGSEARAESGDRVGVLPTRNAARRTGRASVASVSGERGGISAANEGGGKVSNTTCSWFQCYSALQNGLCTVKDAIAALEEYFDAEMPAESQDKLDVIIANLHCRESELEQLISKMETETLK